MKSKSPKKEVKKPKKVKKTFMYKATGGRMM